MAIDITQLQNAVQAARELKLHQMPSSWLELLDKGWTIWCTGDDIPDSHRHHWSWYKPSDLRFGCVCHSDPSQPDLVSTFESYVQDDGGGGSYCSHCKVTINPLERPRICPGCHRRLLKGGITVIPGGSDF